MGNEYLEMPWSIEDTIENLNEIKKIIKVKIKNVNLHGKAESDVKELDFDFGRAVQALEKQIPKKPVEVKPTDKLLNGYMSCPMCGGWVGMDEYSNEYCGNCGQKIDWSW